MPQRDSQPAEIEVTHAEANFVDGKVVIEFHGQAKGFRMMLKFEPRLALNLAHQIEKAWFDGLKPEGTHAE